MEKTVHDFCRKHKVVRKFKANLKKYPWFDKEITVEERMKSKESRHFGLAFSWTKALEGYDFWKNLNRKWYDRT